MPPVAAARRDPGVLRRPERSGGAARAGTRADADRSRRRERRHVRRFGDPGRRAVRLARSRQRRPFDHRRGPGLDRDRAPCRPTARADRRCRPVRRTRGNRAHDARGAGVRRRVRAGGHVRRIRGGGPMPGPPRTSRQRRLCRRCRTPGSRHPVPWSRPDRRAPIPKRTRCSRLRRNRLPQIPTSRPSRSRRPSRLPWMPACRPRPRRRWPSAPQRWPARRSLPPGIASHPSRWHR